MNLLRQPITDTNFVEGLIPQKRPFVMVHSLLYFSNTKIISGFQVAAGQLFTHNKQFMAPGLIENMAQTVALYTGYKYFLEQKKAPEGYIGAIKRAKMYALPKIGSHLETSVEILHDIMDITLVTSKVICDGRLLAESEMKTALAK